MFKLYVGAPYKQSHDKKFQNGSADPVECIQRPAGNGLFKA